MALRFQPVNVDRPAAVSARRAKFGLAGQASLGKADLGVNPFDVVGTTGTVLEAAARVQQWFTAARLAEQHVTSAAAALQDLIDRKEATCGMITHYNEMATRLYKLHGDTWRTFRRLLDTNDLRPPPPPPLFGSAVRTGPAEFGAFVLMVDVPCAQGAGAGPTGQIKRFDLPALVAFRPGETFEGAFRAKSGSELKAAAMSQQLDGLGAAPVLIAGIALEEIVKYAILSVVIVATLKYLLDWLRSSDSEKLQIEYGKIQADCALEQIKFYQRCRKDGGDANVCANAASTVKCPAPFKPARGLLDQASSLVVTVGLVIGGIWAVKALQNRK